jgi:hypothetical protein
MCVIAKAMAYLTPILGKPKAFGRERNAAISLQMRRALTQAPEFIEFAITLLFW